MVFILVLGVLARWWGAFLFGSSCHRGLAAVCLWHKSNHAAVFFPPGRLKIWLGTHTLSCQWAQRESCFIDSIPPSSIRWIRGEQERVSTWAPPATLQPDIVRRLREPVMSSLTSAEIVWPIKLKQKNRVMPYCQFEQQLAIIYLFIFISENFFWSQVFNTWRYTCQEGLWLIFKT